MGRHCCQPLILWCMLASWGLVTLLTTEIGHFESHDLQAWAKIITQLTSLVYVCMIIAVFFIRHLPLMKAPGIVPRVTAIAASNAQLAFFLLPRAMISMRNGNPIRSVDIRGRRSLRVDSHSSAKRLQHLATGAGAHHDGALPAYSPSALCRRGDRFHRPHVAICPAMVGRDHAHRIRLSDPQNALRRAGSRRDISGICALQGTDLPPRSGSLLTVARLRGLREKKSPLTRRAVALLRRAALSLKGRGDFSGARRPLLLSCQRRH